MNVPKIRDAIGELVLGGAEQRVRPIRSKAGAGHARIGAVGSELLLFSTAETSLRGGTMGLPPRLGLETWDMPDAISPCEYARERHRNIARWRNLWTILLFIFGSAVILFLAVAVLAFWQQAIMAGALSTLSTIVGGVAIKWVVDRRTDAVKEEQTAYEDVIARCGQDETASADEFRQRQSLLGKFL
jgi:hypothetical protein